jgi:hypothetical protein
MKHAFLMVLAGFFLSFHALAVAAAKDVNVRCDVGLIPEILERASDLRSTDPTRDLSALILKTVDIQVEPNIIFFDEAPATLNLIKSVHVGDLDLKIYSMMNHIYVDVLKGTTHLSHASYANFDGNAVAGGFTGFVGIGDDKVQAAYTCFKLP